MSEIKKEPEVPVTVGAQPSPLVSDLTLRSASSDSSFLVIQKAREDRFRQEQERFREHRLVVGEQIERTKELLSHLVDCIKDYTKFGSTIERVESNSGKLPREVIAPLDAAIEYLVRKFPGDPEVIDRHVQMVVSGLNDELQIKRIFVAQAAEQVSEALGEVEEIAQASVELGLVGKVRGNNLAAKVRSTRAELESFGNGALDKNPAELGKAVADLRSGLDQRLRQYVHAVGVYKEQLSRSAIENLATQFLDELDQLAEERQRERTRVQSQFVRSIAGRIFRCATTALDLEAERMEVERRPSEEEKALSRQKDFAQKLRRKLLAAEEIEDKGSNAEVDSIERAETSIRQKSNVARLQRKLSTQVRSLAQSEKRSAIKQATRELRSMPIFEDSLYEEGLKIVEREVRKESSAFESRSDRLERSFKLKKAAARKIAARASNGHVDSICAIIDGADVRMKLRQAVFNHNPDLCMLSARCLSDYVSDLAKLQECLEGATASVTYYPEAVSDRLELSSILERYSNKEDGAPRYRSFEFDLAEREIAARIGKLLPERVSNEIAAKILLYGWVGQTKFDGSQRYGMTDICSHVRVETKQSMRFDKKVKRVFEALIEIGALSDKRGNLNLRSFTNPSELDTDLRKALERIQEVHQRYPKTIAPAKAPPKPEAIEVLAVPTKQVNLENERIQRERKRDRDRFNRHLKEVPATVAEAKAQIELLTTGREKVLSRVEEVELWERRKEVEKQHRRKGVDVSRAAQLSSSKDDGNKDSPPGFEKFLSEYVNKKGKGQYGPRYKSIGGASVMYSGRVVPTRGRKKAFEEWELRKVEPVRNEIRSRFQELVSSMSSLRSLAAESLRRELVTSEFVDELRTTTSQATNAFSLKVTHTSTSRELTEQVREKLQTISEDPDQVLSNLSDLMDRYVTAIGDPKQEEGDD